MSTTTHALKFENDDFKLALTLEVPENEHGTLVDPWHRLVFLIMDMMQQPAAVITFDPEVVKRDWKLRR